MVIGFVSGRVPLKSNKKKLLDKKKNVKSLKQDSRVIKIANCGIDT